MKNAQTTTSSLSFSMSNDIEWLLEKLKSQLYLPCHKFTRKLLVTACDNVKTKITGTNLYRFEVLMIIAIFTSKLVSGKLQLLEVSRNYQQNSTKRVS